MTTLTPEDEDKLVRIGMKIHDAWQDYCLATLVPKGQPIDVAKTLPYLETWLGHLKEGLTLMGVDVNEYFK